MTGTTFNIASKTISVEAALAKIKSGDSIMSALGPAEASGILSQLHTIAPTVRDVRVATCLPLGSYPYYMDPAMEGHFYHDAFFFSPAIRKSHDETSISSYVPNHLHRAGLDRLIFAPPTVFVGSCTPPDKHGYVSISLSATFEREIMQVADLVILEINERTPLTFGDTTVHVDEVDYFIHNTHEVYQLPIAQPNARDLLIGSHIAAQIDNGSCLQLGIGGIPNAVTAALLEKRNLAIHTEMFTDGMVDLYNAGCIGSQAGSRGQHFRRQQLTGKMVATFALGTRKLYDFLDGNPGVAIMRGGWVNDPYTIASNKKMVSINTALEVDLTGQVCSESIGPKQFSGTGGQADTAIGAQMSEGGKSFIALYSTADIKQADGSVKTVSKIAPTLMAGAAVTLHRANVDHVVTEYGVVRLKGCPISERVRRLISIAHPDFRPWLEEEAARIGL